MYVQRNWCFIQTIFSSRLFRTRWQRIEEMHDMKDNRFKVVKDAMKKSVKQSKGESDDDDTNEEDLEKELQGMYNWRQKRS